ncbi:MAG: hypothetical protein B7X93_08865 [Hydrogenophilales bacterium 17-61-9]|nr:MAG: hypothetical protein B7X93_08865 [Hydrogenophilales bacterium 17-61-9]
MNSVIETVGGQYFNLLYPCPSTIDLGGMAHALSHLCRFTGHTSSFYSVAQHSFMASLVVPEEFAREALLHDAQEAYIGDVSSPLKRLLPSYSDIESGIEGAIAGKFGLAWTPEARLAVKHADLVMLATERRDLFSNPMGDEWACLAHISPLDMAVVPMTPENARRAFLGRAKELGLN